MSDVLDPSAPEAPKAEQALVSDAAPAAEGQGVGGEQAEAEAAEAAQAADEAQASGGEAASDEGDSPADTTEASGEVESPRDTMEEEQADTTENAISEEHPIPRHFTAPAQIALERVEEDATFLVRDASELEDVAALATDIARLGQLFPVDVRLMPPDRFQIITGFRRVAALRFLKRDKVMARLHTDLSDHDAMLMAVAAAIHGKEVGAGALEALRAKLESMGRLTPAARDMLEKALSGDGALAPEEAEEEVDADELAADATVRLSQLNQDLSLLADVFKDLDPARREELLTQLKYSVDLVAFLESLS